MGRQPVYPFAPRSNAHLMPGQFWAVPLPDGRFACGRVLASARDLDDPVLAGRSRVSFLAGLMDWVGAEPPTGDAIAGTTVIEQGNAHIKTILETGGEVLGQRDLALDNIVGLRRVSHRAPSPDLYEGATRLRPATEAEASELQVLGTWGYKVIERLAVSRFAADASR